MKFDKLIKSLLEGKMDEMSPEEREAYEDQLNKREGYKEHLYSSQSQEMDWAEEQDKHDTMLFKMAGEVYQAAPDLIDKIYKMGRGDFKKFLGFLDEVAKFKQGTYL